MGSNDKQSAAMIGLLKELTGGQFRSGAIAKIVARDFWSGGRAPTFRGVCGGVAGGGKGAYRAESGAGFFVGPGE